MEESESEVVAAEAEKSSVVTEEPIVKAEEPVENTPVVNIMLWNLKAPGGRARILYKILNNILRRFASQNII